MVSSLRVKIFENYLNQVDFDKSTISYFKGKKILVTGGAGAIGSNLILMLSEFVGPKGLIFCLDNLSTNKHSKAVDFPDCSNVLFIKGDVKNDEDLKRVFRENIDIVFHLAAFFANQNSVDFPESSANTDILGLIKLLDLSILNQVDKFIYASSGCSIYGSYGKMPLKENFISMNLTTPYQINKMAGEMYTNFYHHHYSLKTVNCRFFNSFGPGEVPGQYRNVIPNFIYWSMNNIPIPITGTGNETRDFTYVYDLVQGLIKSCSSNNAIGKSFNLASGKETKIIDMKKSIDEILNKKTQIIFKKTRKWDTKKRLRASVLLAQKTFNYKPVYKFKQGLEDNINWFYENLDIINDVSDFPPGLSSAVR